MGRDFTSELFTFRLSPGNWCDCGVVEQQCCWPGGGGGEGLRAAEGRLEQQCAHVTREGGGEGCCRVPTLCACVCVWSGRIFGQACTVHSHGWGVDVFDDTSRQVSQLKLIFATGFVRLAFVLHPSCCWHSPVSFPLGFILAPAAAVMGPNFCVSPAWLGPGPGHSQDIWYTYALAVRLGKRFFWGKKGRFWHKKCPCCLTELSVLGWKSCFLNIYFNWQKINNVSVIKKT